jgi:hypothetical protein
MWTGQGMNYKGGQSYWEADATELLSIGISKVRIHIPAIVDQYWRDCAIYFKSRGFYVIAGITEGSTLTAANWDTYATKVVDEATYAQANSMCDEFLIGNELHYKIDGTTLTQAQLRTNLKTLATSVKAVFSGYVTYSFDTNGEPVTGWVAEGRGTIDYLAYNAYNEYVQVGNNGYIWERQTTNNVPGLIAEFGDNFYISEFHIDSSSAEIGALQNDTIYTTYRRMYKMLYDYGASRIYAFGWVGFKHQGDDNFSMKTIAGNYNDVWNVIKNGLGRKTLVNIP